MSDNNTKLESIIQKINRVIDNCLALEEENFLLENEIRELKKKQKEEDVRTSKLEEKLNKLKLSKGLLMEGKESKRVKEQIDSYLKEIDKCITMLNS